MGVLDLITRFILDPKGYQDGAKVVEETTKRVTGLVDGLRNGIMSGLGTALRMAFNPLAALAGGAGLLALGHDAVTAAIGFDTISRSLEAVTQNAALAKGILKFDDNLAGPSIFTSEQLAQASLTLEAFKLKTEEFLPVAEKLGTVFGGTADSLKEFVDALGYINNGRFGEGFESLTRAGFSRSDFEAKGLQFDKGGAYQGNSEQALKAVKELTDERFGQLSKAMAEGPAAKLASVMDAIGRAARQAGSAILSVLMPAAEKVAGFVSYLVDSGAVERAMTGIAGLFSGKNIGDGLVSIMARIQATIEELPTLFAIAKTGIEGFFTYIRDNIKTIGALIVGAFVFAPILEGLGLLVAGITAVRKALMAGEIAALLLQAAMGGAAAIGKILLATSLAFAAGYLAMQGLDRLAKSSIDTSVVNQLTKAGQDIDNRTKALLSGYGNGGGSGTVSTLRDMAMQVALMRAGQGGQTSVLGQIGEHTRKTEANTKKLADIQDSILGGGAVGAGAAGAVGMDKALGQGLTRGGGDKLDRAVRLIREHVVEYVGGEIVATKMRNRGRN